MRDPSGRRRFGFFPLFIFLILFIVTLAVQWLWNNVLVTVAAVRPVTYWQAMGLLVLFRILFGSFRFNPPMGQPPFAGGSAWRSRFRQMSDEDREEFREEWQRRCRKRP